MSRFIQEEHKPKPEERPERELPKPGKYTHEDLDNVKPIITPNGGKR